MIEPFTAASDDTRVATIAHLNDRTRQGLDRTARIMMTSSCLATFAPGDRAGGIVAQAQLLAALRRHEFSEAEARERDRGSFTFRGTTVYFRIDYYDADLAYGSENPADANVTRRVLTIMLREDL